jgi:hypothetical protein
MGSENNWEMSMSTQVYPWRVTGDFAQIVNLARPVLVGLGVVSADGGASESEIAAAEARMGRPLPGDVRAFHAAMRPMELFERGSRREFGFYPLGSAEFVWHSMEGAEPVEEWTAAQGLRLGQSAFGDPFWWIEGHRSLPNGTIVMMDHDGGLGGDAPFVCFARTFGEFIAKIAHFKGLYAPAGDPLFASELRELNPSGGF